MRLLPWQKDAVVDGVNQSLLKLGGGVLIVGAAGHGRIALMERLAKAKLCRQPTEQGDACGSCSSCNYTDHPDLHWLTSDQGKLIPIDAVRELAIKLQKTAQQGGARVALIDPASHMSIGATNALLKTLEEPGEDTLLILGCPSITKVLPTIRSRCRIIRAPDASNQDAEQWLAMRGHDSATIERALKAGFGEPLVAETLLEEGTLDSYDSFLDDIAEVATGSIDPAALGQRWSKTDCTQLVDWWAGMLHRRLLSEAPGLTALLLHKFYKQLVKGRIQSLSLSNLNSQMIIEQLAIQWFQTHRRIARGAQGPLSAHERSVCSD